MRTRSWISAACGLMMTVVGCGGGQDRLTASGYARAASSTCAHANRMLERVQIPTLSREHEAARAMTRTVAIARDMIHELRHLRPPEHWAGTVQRWIALLDQAADELELMADHLRAERFDDAVEFGAKATILFDRAEQLVARLRVTSCRGPELPIA